MMAATGNCRIAGVMMRYLPSIRDEASEGKERVFVGYFNPFPWVRGSCMDRCVAP